MVKVLIRAHERVYDLKKPRDMGYGFNVQGSYDRFKTRGKNGLGATTWGSRICLNDLRKAVRFSVIV
jgi:hypothetical protein